MKEDLKKKLKEVRKGVANSSVAFSIVVGIDGMSFVREVLMLLNMVGGVGVGHLLVVFLIFFAFCGFEREG